MVAPCRRSALLPVARGVLLQTRVQPGSARCATIQTATGMPATGRSPVPPEAVGVRRPALAVAIPPAGLSWLAASEAARWAAADPPQAAPARPRAAAENEPFWAALLRLPSAALAGGRRSSACPGSAVPPPCPRPAPRWPWPPHGKGARRGARDPWPAPRRPGGRARHRPFAARGSPCALVHALLTRPCAMRSRLTSSGKRGKLGR